MMYAWLNVETGGFSNSWTEEEHKKLFDHEMIEQHYKEYPQWKLIHYECVNDEGFEFIHHMKLR